ncbi:MAG TPA: hypothetical protein VK911_04540 [Vicinamibacterales bacterium]|nr:hypothetical protein [Vicinamibacterales bacterium]
MVRQAILAMLAAGSLAACTGDTGMVGDEASQRTGTEQAVTLTGCVEGGSPAGTFVLRSTGGGDVASGEGAAPRGGEATGTSGEAGSASGGTGGTSAGGRDAAMRTPHGTYRLIPAGNDLGRYLGKEVRLTGEIANGYTDRMEEGETPEGARERASGEGDVGRGVASRPNEGSGAGAVQPESADQSTAGQFIRVQSIQQVADSCR